MAIGISIRFYRIHELEPRIWDEGMYVLEGRFLSTLSAAVSQSAQRFLKEKFTGEDLWKKDEQLPLLRQKVRGLPPHYGRILHDAFLGLGNLLLGETAYVGHIVNALFGSLTILLIFSLARLMFNERTGLYAAMVFALMGYHIHYCRSALAEADSLFFEVAAVYFYYKSRYRFPVLSDRHMSWCGLLLGLGFTVHNRSIVIAALIGAMEALLCLKSGLIPPPHERRKRMLLFAACFLLPSFLWEALYHVVLIVFQHLQTIMTAPTFLEQIALAFWHSLLWGYISDNFRAAGFLTFPYLYLYMNGIVALVVLLVGIIATFRHRGLAGWMLGVWFLVPFVLYSLTNAGLTRFFTLMLPPAAIMSAAGLVFIEGLLLDRTIQWKSLRTVLWFVALCALLGTQVHATLTRVMPSRSSYGTTVAWIQSRGQAHMIATGVPLFQVYAGVEHVQRPPATMEELEDLYHQGFRYYVIDYNRLIYTYYQTDRVKIMDHISEELEPLLSEPNTCIVQPPYAFEGNLYFWKTIEIIKKARDEEMDRIRVYDLDEYFSARGNDTHEPGSGPLSKGHDTAYRIDTHGPLSYTWAWKRSYARQ